MKKAFIDTIMLGFLLLGTVVVFISTTVDDIVVRDKYDNLNKLALSSVRTLAKHYMYNGDMNAAEAVSNAVLNETTLGSELVSNGNINYIWRDSDSDGAPNTVTVEIDNYQQNTFWYRFLSKDNFDLPKIEVAAYVTKDQSDIIAIAIRYGGSDAGYDNMIGTYELDENGECQNAKLLIDNRNDFNVGDELGSFTNLSTRFFIIPNGYNWFGNQTTTLDSSIDIFNCDTGGIPSVTIDGATDLTTTYYQDPEFNNDGGYDHMQEVGKTYFDDYLEYIAGEDICISWDRRGRCREYEHTSPTWEDWVQYAGDNNIDFANDPNDEYIIAMEDLPNGGDADYDDIKLDTTKIRQPRTVDIVDIQNDTILVP